MIHAARGIAATLLVVLLVLSPASALAQTPPPDQPNPIPVERLGDLVPWPAGTLPGGRGPLSHGLDGVSDPLVSVIVQFEAPALAARAVERGQMTTFDQRSYTATLHSRQAEVVSRVQQTGGAVIGQFTKAYNGVQVQVPASELAELRKASGVKAIHPVRTYYPALDHSTEIIRANEVWALNGTGYDGDGVTIAVIDTGIDYTHAAFGGPGTAAAYSSNDKRIIEPGTFPTSKVIGGWDFAGTEYDPGSDYLLQRTPHDDPDPLDENGHGTHVASTAAGLTVDGVLSQGVAPGAGLYALKVFGASGGTQLVIPALEWCMDPNGDGNTDDRVDVVNLSLGMDFGPADPLDPMIVAIENLANVGTVIVAASGNAYNTEYITSAPASADSAISVAATTSNGDDGGDDDLMADFSSRGPRGYDSALKPEISAPGTAIFAASMGTGNQGKNLKGTSMATPHVAGVAALVRQAHPEWTAEQVKAAIMNTAVDLGHENPRMGAGRVDALRAVTTETVAVGNPRLVSLSWGVIEFNEAVFTTSNQVAVRNISNAEKTYTITATWGNGSHTTGAVVNPEASVTIPANDSRPFTVELQLNAAEIDEWVTTSPGLEEYYGFIRLQNQSDENDVLLVPFYFLPTPYTEITAHPLTVDGSSASGTFDHNGPIPSGLSAHTVYVFDSNDPSIRDNADLRLVTMDYIPDGGGRVVFGFNLYDAFHNPQFYFVEIDLYLDIDQDGRDDYVIFNYDRGRWNDGKQSGFFNNQWMLIKVNPLTSVAEKISGATIFTDFNSGTMFWELPVSLFGSTDSKFDFYAVSFDYDYAVDFEYDITSLRSVDYLDQPLSVELGTHTPHGDQDVAVTIARQPDSYNAPLGVALFDSKGQPGEGQAAFFSFDVDFYTLSYDAFPTGGMIGRTPAGMYPPGTDIELEAIPLRDYYFVKWLVNGEEFTTRTIYFTLNADHSVAAFFEPYDKVYLPLIMR